MAPDPHVTGGGWGGCLLLSGKMGKSRVINHGLAGCTVYDLQHCSDLPVRGEDKKQTKSEWSLLLF